MILAIFCKYLCELTKARTVRNGDIKKFWAQKLHLKNRQNLHVLVFILFLKGNQISTFYDFSTIR